MYATLGISLAVEANRNKNDDNIDYDVDSCRLCHEWFGSSCSMPLSVLRSSNLYATGDSKLFRGVSRHD